MVHCLRGLEQRNQLAIAHQFELVLFVVVGPFAERVRQARRGGRRAEREGLYLFHEVLKAAALLCRTVILLLHLLIMRINSQFNFIDRKQTDSCDLSCTRSLAWHHFTIIHCQVFITSPIKTAFFCREPHHLQARGLFGRRGLLTAGDRHPTRQKDRGLLVAVR